MKVISIFGQKGGCGKTTVTTLLASCFAYVYGKKVVVLDCDTSQQTFSRFRDKNIADSTPYKEEEIVKDEKGNPILDEKGNPKKEIVTKVNDYDLFMAVRNRKKVCDAYKVVKGIQKAEPVLAYLRDREKEGYDYAFLDMPGSADSPEYNRIMSICDVIFIPFIGDFRMFDTNTTFVANNVRKILALNTNLKKVYGFWNRYKKNVRKQEFQEFCDIIKRDLPEVEMLENKLGDTDAAGNQLFLNTLTAPIKWKDSGNSTAFVEEIFKKIEQIN